MLDPQQIARVRAIIHSLLARCDMTYKPPEFDHELYQAVIEEAKRRGYPTDGHPSVWTYMKDSFDLATTVYAHLDRQTRLSLVFHGIGGFYIDDASIRFPLAMPDIYQFHKRFVGNQPQGHKMLDVFADAVRDMLALFERLASNFILASNMNFVAATLVEYETRSMERCSAAQGYTDYLRARTSLAEGCAYITFPREIPLADYVQAIPDIAQFAYMVNDVLSFYKEELRDDEENQISIRAAENNKPKLLILEEMVETLVGLHKGITKILENSPEALAAFKSYASGHVCYHLAAKRYKLADLDF